VIVNSAKVENEHMKIAGGKGSGFIPTPELPGGGTQQPRLIKGRSSASD